MSTYRKVMDFLTRHPVKPRAKQAPALLDNQRLLAESPETKQEQLSLADLRQMLLEPPKAVLDI